MYKRQLTSLALGTTKEAQRIDGHGIETSKRYIHHNNFPPFSVGEIGFMRGPKRRDIGHGALAERALLPMIPAEDEFPYTLRIVSETLESNGSSSMASVCGSTLALLDAGVPIARPVAGIAMGLIKEGDDYIILSDIQGDEDHLGDMDFKVAGTEKGINALQMDIKITGVSFDILRDALAQAKKGREHILGIMNEVIDAPRTELSAWAPRMVSPPLPMTAPIFSGSILIEVIFGANCESCSRGPSMDSAILPRMNWRPWLACSPVASASRPASASSTTTTSRRSASGRSASCVARSAATSATAPSPSGPSCR